MKPTRRFSAFSTSALLMLILVSSCSVFQSSRQMDMTPFSQNATTMFAEAAKVSTPFQWKELKKYQNIPELVELRDRAFPLIGALKGIVRYSHQLVALNSAQLSESIKNQRLAEYIERGSRSALKKGPLDDIGISGTEIDSVLVNVRAAETFLGGIAAASPLVDAIVFSMNERLEGIAQSLPVITAAFDQRIEADQADQKRNLLEFRRLQAKWHLAIALLYHAKMGDDRALDTLLTVDPSLREFIDPSGPTTGKNWIAAEDALTERLSRVHEFMSQLKVEAQIYRAKQQELQEWGAQVEEKIKIARDALLVWAQSHHNLGQGIPVPPLVDVTGIAGGLARKVVPAP